MTTFRFNLIGKAQPVEVDIAAASIEALDEIISCRRFLTGRLAQPDEAGVLLGILIATSRIECVVET